MNDSIHRPGLRFIPMFASVFAAVAALCMVSAPAIDFILILFTGKGIPGATPFAQHAGVILAFAGAVCASSDRSHLAFSLRPRESAGNVSARESLILAVSVAVESLWAWSSLSFLLIGFADGKGGFPGLGIFAAAFPVGFVLMASADLAATPLRGFPRIAAFLAGFLAGSALAGGSAANIASFFGMDPVFSGNLDSISSLIADKAFIPLALVLLVSGFFGAPLFVLLSGLAGLLFVRNGMLVELAVSESWSLLRSSSVSAIPVFTLTGFILAATGSGDRIVAVSRAAFGRIRGGTVLASVFACALFSTFTGSNGLAIFALGPILVSLVSEGEGMPVKDARGLITSSGALGLLFPPSLALIVYGVTARFSYGPYGIYDLPDYFRGGIIPGLLFLGVTAAVGLSKIPRRSATMSEPQRIRLVPALIAALPELFIPLILAALFFTGTAGVFEAGALSVFYILAWGFLRRSCTLRSLAETSRKTFPVIGGTLLLLASARALSYFIIDAGIPSLLADFISATTSSRYIFLAAVTIVLLAAGCIMDIFSAILVLAPLIIPVAEHFGVHPVHLCSIFITNLAVGFLTPPVGMNLFISSFAFGTPLGMIWRSARRYFFAQLAVVLLVAFLPWLSLALL